MEKLNIKDYLQINDTTPVKKKEPASYNFSLVFDNGSDFVIERSTNNKIKRQLCFIANENLLFIRDPKGNKDKPLTTERQIKDFFIMDDNIKDLEFKNNFFNSQSVSSFAYNILKLHGEKIKLRRNFIKYGLNPTNYIVTNRWSGDSELGALDNFGFEKLLKVIKIVQEYEDKLHKKNSDYKVQICAEFILFLCRLQELYSIDYVRMFLDIYTSYDSKLEVVMSDYDHYNHTGIWKFVNFERLIEDFNLDFKRFCTYLFRDLYSEGIVTIEGKILEDYYDCLNMQKEIYGKVKDKYPTHFKETHDRTVLIYNLNLEYFKEKKIEELNVHNKFLEFSDKNYSVIVAKTSQDLIEEGINLHHCVGSYVNKVKNAECSIFFLRKTDDIDTSLITIEVVEDKIYQVRGLCERRMDENERKFLNKWCKTKGLTLVGE